MIKINMGDITNPKTEVTKDIIVKAKTPNNLKDMVLGGSMILAGIAYLTTTAFKNGVKKMDEAEFKTMSELGLFSNTKPE